MMKKSRPGQDPRICHSCLGIHSSSIKQILNLQLPSRCVRILQILTANFSINQ